MMEVEERRLLPFAEGMSLSLPSFGSGSEENEQALEAYRWARPPVLSLAKPSFSLLAPSLLQSKEAEGQSDWAGYSGEALSSTPVIGSHIAASLRVE